ncbi:hypothetical protein DOTSEDRAFT_81598 [Dothistroma septosporum NZE10]|uniref:Uncharacterized protein n=1 Tax=Dothistroma septosporum (strain NZE10 / CBS 128990) TaxID=675120 RepID=N1PGH7_DOTSN|nr:hypothetical protein DOTSEDRAFT_81598 [Dothistroma septosporum NZE10]
MHMSGSKPNHNYITSTENLRPTPTRFESTLHSTTATTTATTSAALAGPTYTAPVNFCQCSQAIQGVATYLGFGVPAVDGVCGNDLTTSPPALATSATILITTSTTTTTSAASAPTCTSNSGSCRCVSEYDGSANYLTKDLVGTYCGDNTDCKSGQFCSLYSQCYTKYTLDQCTVNSLTTTTTTTTTTTSAAPQPTSCSKAQEDFCTANGGCKCGLQTDHTSATCWNQQFCVGCQSNADCPLDYQCVYDDNDYCDGTNDVAGTLCVLVDSACPGTPPSRQAKRELEHGPESHLFADSEDGNACLRIFGRGNAMSSTVEPQRQLRWRL